MSKPKFEHHWNREYSLFTGLGAQLSLLDVYKKELRTAAAVRGEGYNGRFDSYSTQGLLGKLAQKFQRKISAGDYEYVQKRINELHKTGHELVRFAKKINVSKRTPTARLINLHHAFYNELYQYLGPLWKTFYLVEAAQVVVEQQLAKKVAPEKLMAAITHYARPKKKVGLYLIAAYFEKEKSIAKRVAYVQQRYAWMASVDAFIPPQTKKQITEYARSFVPATKDAQSKNLNLPFTKKEQQLLSLYQELLFIKDKRDEYRREAFYYAYQLMTELARRLGLSVEELGTLTPDEVTIAERGLEMLHNEARQRIKGYFFEVNNGKLIIKSGPSAVKNLLSRKQHQEASIAGVAASAGIAQGNARVIRRSKDIGSFKKGEILVVITTNPEHISAMQKAVAFVTDEGSITCHAAIVAREMNKPCVVGTKNATHIFKTGDRIEVDAHSGVVKKL